MQSDGVGARLGLLGGRARAGCAEDREQLLRGAACTASGQCDEIHGVFCNPVSGKCEPISFAAAGGTCGLVNSALVVCSGPGSFCSGSSVAPYKGTCLAFAQDGASCDVDAGPLCDVGATCVAGTCQFPAPSTCH